MFLYIAKKARGKKQEKKLTHLWTETGKKSRRAVSTYEQKEENRNHVVDAFLGWEIVRGNREEKLYENNLLTSRLPTGDQHALFDHSLFRWRISVNKSDFY